MQYTAAWAGFSATGDQLTSFPTFRKLGQEVRDHFIPHPRNNFHPHILSHRLLALFSLLLLSVKIAVIGLTLTVGTAQPVLADITQNDIINLTNQSRQDASLAVLAFNAKLTQAAQTKANDMAAKGYFSHDTPDGKTPWDFIKAAGYRYWSAGENLAVDFTESNNVEVAWMNSPGHRANILNKDFTQIGVGVASGTYQGHSTLYVVQMFGSPMDQPVVLQDKPTPVAVKAESVASVPAPAAVLAAARATAPVAAQPAPAANDPEKIKDTQASLTGDNLLVTVRASEDTTKLVANFGDQAVMLAPRGANLWQGLIPVANLLPNQGLALKAYTMSGSAQEVKLAEMSPAPAPGNVISVFGTKLDLSLLEQRFYLLFITGMLVCLLLAIAIRHHVQHLSLIANSSFVVILAALLYAAH